MEKIAFHVADWPPYAWTLLSYVSSIAGAVLSARTYDGRGTLPRVPYFFRYCLIFFGVALASQTLLAIPFAIVGGYFAVLLLFVLVFVPLVGGFFVCRIAMERSRDAFDHPFGAILAFIPIANFYLFFARNREPVFGRQMRTRRRPDGGFAIVIGLVLLASGIALNRTLPARVERFTDSILSLPAMERPTLEALLRGMGLAETLDAMVDGTQLPFKLDDGRILIDVERQGRKLVFSYSVVSDDGASVELWSNGLVEGNCSDPDLRLLMDAGATIEHIFLSRSDGYEDGRVTIDGEVCGD